MNHAETTETCSSVRRLEFETITLKQFRDTQKPDRACYQAIVSSPMGIDRVNRYGRWATTT